MVQKFVLWRRRGAVAGTLGLALLLGACGGGGGSPADAQAPSVSLTAAPSTPAPGESVTLQATATDNVAVVKVEFLEGGAVLGSDESAPYTLTLTPGSGTHSYVARALDAAGNAGVSAPQVVTVAVSSAGVFDSSVWDGATFQ